MAKRLEVRGCRRPITPGSPTSFDLAYVRTGGGTGLPLLVIPGGPGLASILPYCGLREQARRRGVDLLMVEHRGVGFSRRTHDGGDLPADAMTLDKAADDLAAVLDHEQIDRAVVYGASYGSYLAQLFGVRHPDRVAGMVLDSPMLRAGDHDRVRTHLRARLWDDGPEATRAASLLHHAVAQGRVDPDRATTVVQPVYEFAGQRTLERLLELRLAGRGARLWEWISRLGAKEVTDVTPYVMEFDLVGRIAYRELDYAPRPDGRPLDLNPLRSAAADRFPTFESEPTDLPAALEHAHWPIAVVSGERDLRTPRPIAEEIVATAADAVLVPLVDTGHSALDTHPTAALHIAHAVQLGDHHRLPARADRIAALPRRGSSRVLTWLMRASIGSQRRLLPSRGTAD